MKKTLITAAALVIAGALTVQAQDTSTTRIPVHKDYYPTTTSSSSGTYVAPGSTLTTTVDTTAMWYVPAGATTCSTVDPAAASAVAIKTDLYNPSAGMISPDSAKIIALCAVPGQIGSGEMNVANGVTEYAIDIIPNHKKTHTKVIVDAMTGAVLSSKQFGGARGFAGWVRESKEHKQNVNKAAKDTMPPL
ncbi:MAG TPA: PepSY domain-containing protein [Casimicrobiaceae bacterium]|nr:PepSY domain-containing protein [Casimicrobiaceae bacterium]